jgi:hypothetical protein
MPEPHLDPWIYDLITVVDDYEDQHAPVDHDAGDEAWPRFATVLAAIPAEHIDRARAIAHYRRKTEHEPTPEPSR